MQVYTPESLEVTYSFLSQIQTDSVKSILLWMFIICSVTVLRHFSQGLSFIYVIGRQPLP